MDLRLFFTRLITIIMVKYFLFLLSLSSFLFSNGQSLEVVLRPGFQYYGISYIARNDPDPSDFKKSWPKFAVTYGADIKYKPKELMHVLSIQSIALGPSFAFSNIFLDKVYITIEKCTT